MIASSTLGYTELSLPKKQTELFGPLIDIILFNDSAVDHY